MLITFWDRLNTCCWPSLRKMLPFHFQTHYRGCTIYSAWRRSLQPVVEPCDAMLAIAVINLHWMRNASVCIVMTLVSTLLVCQTTVSSSAKTKVDGRSYLEIQPTHQTTGTCPSFCNPSRINFCLGAPLWSCSLFIPINLWDSKVIQSRSNCSVGENNIDQNRTIVQV